MSSGGVADGLLDLGHEELVDRSLGAVRDPVEAVGEAPADVSRSISASTMAHPRAWT